VSIRYNELITGKTYTVRPVFYLWGLEIVEKQSKTFKVKSEDEKNIVGTWSFTITHPETETSSLPRIIEGTARLTPLIDPKRSYQSNILPNILLILYTNRLEYLSNFLYSRD
jgi:hypothetical protein